MTRTYILATTLLTTTLLATACRHKEAQAPIQTATVTRRNIVVTAQATGTVEPIDTVAVKSQASGLIISMPVEVGTQVKPGDLIAQIDTRNLKNDYDRAVAAANAAKATLAVDSAALARANALYAEKVITADEHESAVVAAANARSQLTSAQTALKTAQQNLEYATVRAEVAGTVISKTSSVGTVVSSAISTYGGGSTIITIADLSRVRMRALVNETDVGNVHAGMPVTVTIDAFPNRQFRGIVEKVEPQATIQNSVTMFPVLVSLQNLDQSLLPGMNGEVTIVTQQRQNVLAVPNDAVRSMSDLATAAMAFGLSPDSAQAMIRSSFATMRNGASRQMGTNRTGDTVNKRGVAAAGDSTSRRGTGTGGMAGGAGAARFGMGAGRAGASAQFVMVKHDSGWAPQAVRLGVSDYDYSEILRGLKEGDVVALLSTTLLQAQRNARSDRVRSMTGAGLPGSGSSSRRTSGSARGGGRGGSR
jgi:HlyD family secretion protein